MFSIILWCLLAYFLYRFIVGFLIPVIRATRQMKRQVKNFQQQANQHFSGQQSFGQQAYDTNAKMESDSSKQPSSKGDYIDFEEIKD